MFRYRSLRMQGAVTVEVRFHMLKRCLISEGAMNVADGLGHVRAKLMIIHDLKIHLSLQ